jgi:hypothetical protein
MKKITIEEFRKYITSQGKPVNPYFQEKQDALALRSDLGLHCYSTLITKGQIPLPHLRSKAPALDFGH